MRLYLVLGTSTKHACDLEANSRVWTASVPAVKGTMGMMIIETWECVLSNRLFSDIIKPYFSYGRVVKKEPKSMTVWLFCRNLHPVVERA